MTAMCDVAFLLLSFFILATKTKPPEAVVVMTPSSVSTKIAKENAIMVTLTKEGKIYLMLGDKAKKQAILEDINTTRGLGLSPAEITKLRKMEFIGMPLNKIKSMLQLSEPMEPKSMEGIPVIDTLNNELTYWIGSVVRSYTGESIDNLNLLVKGDNAAKYPTFKLVKDAFKKNSIFKFKIVTNPEGVPADSELALNPPGGPAAEPEKK